MTKKPLHPKDLAIFHQAIEGAKPLQKEKVRLVKKNTRLPPPKTALSENEFHIPMSETDKVKPVRAEDFIVYKQASISHKILRKLRKGQYNVEAVLDLHGMTVEEARSATESFLRQCLREEIRVALIIHGKGYHSGMPILKNKLNQWLRQLAIVLAFCSADPEHGSRGAIYVLIKRTQEEKFV